MKTVRLIYNLKNHLMFELDEPGDVVLFFVNGVNRTEDGDAIEAGIAAVLESGNDLQADISEAFDQLYWKQCYGNDPMYLDKAKAELRLELGI